jgi:glc operon protein GlcG
VTGELTLALAQRVLEAALRIAIARRATVSISVVDRRGDLVAMLRLDGAPWYTVPVSRGKAAASAAFGVSSAELASRADTPAFRALLHHGEGLIAQRGAIPLRFGEHLLGAVGVSGATGEEDEQLAEGGASALLNHGGL